MTVMRVAREARGADDYDLGIVVSVSEILLDRLCRVFGERHT